MKTQKGKMGLFIPPAYDRVEPPLGTPALAGFLKSKGIRVVQGDLNMRYYDFIRKQRLARVLKPEYEETKIKKKVYYYRLLRYKGAQKKKGYAFEYNPGSSFTFTEKLLSSKFLYRYISDRKENLFVKFFFKEFLPRIKKENFFLIGFSIISPSQVIASFTFGYLIKKYFPQTKVVIGGQWVSFFREALQKRNDFDRFYDYIIYFEGETPLLNLIEVLKYGRPISEVPNLIYKNKNHWQLSAKINDENMDELPAPDFDGLPLKKYGGSKKGKKISLTLETSRGCYWNRCIFCVDLPLPKSRYREKSPALVIRDIKNLIKKYKAKLFTISNATFSPWQLREVAQRILKEKIKISWWAFARFDEGLDRKTLKLAKDAGCSRMGFGLESINQRVLDFIDKGTKAKTIKRIIKDAHDLKLEIYFQTMIGVPSETVQESLDTVQFLNGLPYAQDKEPCYNIYYLTPKNKVFLNPEKFGIKVTNNRHLPFRYFYRFKHLTGEIDQPKAEKIINSCFMIKRMMLKRKLKAQA